ncbi:SDR family NAD(P)-dependent oxidoreductase [Hydrogenophaga sp. BPS33]|uniref:SDR family NAD(P)-dependent oxidoreductase n=1 Tax=Hydrogenophaga sp. BPS33 TaxID=2651974 RepID=UPI00131FD6C0|nr:SDR family NAD(P)-dependent oxidoreductase [Hydrogenophaga sp. BPS33]QHE84160.1 SDR family oxidoreductase [Hydrogenophaga sp. BPS33]
MSVNSISLEGKVALVTGAGGGIGRAVAVAMARAGARIVINDLGTSLKGEGQSGSPAQETQALVEGLGGQAVINTDSVSDWAGAQRMVQMAVDQFGRIDVVVNNAGILRDAIFHKMSVDDWNSVVQVHLNGTFFVSRAAAEHFRRQASGAYVHMTSGAGLVGTVGQANYCAAKLGIVSLSKAIALDMGRYNIRSNCIAPIAWGRMTDAIPSDTEEQRARIKILQQMTPEKNAPLAVFLASDAAREVNAQVFAIRMNEIFLMSQPRPLRSVHRSEGWTPETIAQHAVPALQPHFLSVSTSPELYPWDPI